MKRVGNPSSTPGTSGPPSATHDLMGRLIWALHGASRVADS